MTNKHMQNSNQIATRYLPTNLSYYHSRSSFNLVVPQRREDAAADGALELDMRPLLKTFFVKHMVAWRNLKTRKNGEEQGYNIPRTVKYSTTYQVVARVKVYDVAADSTVHASGIGVPACAGCWMRRSRRSGTAAAVAIGVVSDVIIFVSQQTTRLQIAHFYFIFFTSVVAVAVVIAAVPEESLQSSAVAGGPRPSRSAVGAAVDIGAACHWRGSRAATADAGRGDVTDTFIAAGIISTIVTTNAATAIAATCVASREGSAQMGRDGALVVVLGGQPLLRNEETRPQCGLQHQQAHLHRHPDDQHPASGH